MTGGLHHVELWVEDLPTARARVGWLLDRLGWTVERHWPTGVQWRHGAVYLVLECGPDVLPGRHQRRRPGLNHLAFDAGTSAEVEALVAEAPGHGWSLMFSDLHPWAGGPRHYAAYLEDEDGFEIELVALLVE